MIAIDSLVSNWILKVNAILALPTLLFVYDHYVLKRNTKHIDLWSPLLILLAIAVCSLMCINQSLTSTFVCYEILTLLTIPLICKKYDQMFYGYYLFIVSIIVLLPCLILTEVLDPKSLNNIITPAVQSVMSPKVLVFASENGIANLPMALFMLLTLIGVAKASVFPSHSWLVKASHAPYPVSAVLHAVVMVNVGIVTLMRIYQKLSFQHVELSILAVCLSVCYGGAKAIYEQNIKRLLVFSTISSASMVLLVLLVFSHHIAQLELSKPLLDLITTSTAQFLIFNSIMKFILFVNFYLIKHQDVNSLRGLIYRSPVKSILLLITLMIYSGIQFPWLENTVSFLNKSLQNYGMSPWLASMYGVENNVVSLMQESAYQHNMALIFKGLTVICHIYMLRITALIVWPSSYKK